MSLRVLILTRDAGLLTVVQPLLAEFGMADEVCNELDVARELLARTRYDAVLIDCEGVARGSDILDDMQRVERNRSSVLIAVVEGAPGREVHAPGATFILKKPVRAHDARQTLAQADHLMRRPKRRHIRYRASFPVYLSCDNAFDLQGNALNVSEGGMALQLSAARLEEPYVWLRFVLPTTTHRLRLQARVAWQQANGLIGVSFLEVPAPVLKQLQHWAALQASSLQED
jgi:DNA-binding response OmpR family regulator